MLEAAHALFLAVGDVRGGAVALARTSVILARMGDTRARGRTAAALELLEPLLPGPELVQVLSEYAGDAFISDDLDRTSQVLKRAPRSPRRWGCPPRHVRWASSVVQLPLADPACRSTTCDKPWRSPMNRDLGEKGVLSGTTSRTRLRRWRAPARGSKHGVTRSSSPAAAAARSS